MGHYFFTVDAQLLRELGERLVGQPQIALAELIKNSYDADATRVEIDFFDDTITVTDNGHGMSERDFVERWMRIGTTKKRDAGVSPLLDRSLTGSKGVGRLAAQLLARQMVLQSVAKSDPTGFDAAETEPGIHVTVDWDLAVEAGDLTSVSVPFRNLDSGQTFAGGSSTGTRVALSSLTESWDEDRFGALAQEIWALQPPFELDDSREFDVVLKSEHDDIVTEFGRQMNAIFSIWNARITGRLLPLGEDPPTPPSRVLPRKLPDVADGDGDGANFVDDPDWEESRKIELARERLADRYFTASVVLKDQSERTVTWLIDQCDIDELEFEVRVFDLVRRQPAGIKVSEARGYLRRFGGVGIYDNGFRLPYYGAEQDWLKIERDHSARLGHSELVPKELAVSKGLQDLPTNRRLFGWVSVSTTHEEEHRKELGIQDVRGLSIQVTRDRLTDNHAYRRLQVMMRAAVDLYAMERARAKIPASRPVDAPAPAPPSTYVEEVVRTLNSVKSRIPEPVYEDLKAGLDEAVARTKKSEESTQSYSALLGALATAGMTSLAYEHEMSKQVGAIRGLATSLERLLPKMNGEVRERVQETAVAMRAWEKRVRAIRQVFRPLLAQETRESVDRYRAQATVESIVDQLRGLARGVKPDTRGIPQDLRLPRATYPAWSSIFQNVILNAYNALHDQPTPVVLIDGGGDDRSGWIRVMDNGAGVDLQSASELWKPFERRLVLPPDLEAAGMGGMGMGLTIVRMIVDDIGVSARFVAPPEGMSTALRIDWKGKR